MMQDRRLSASLGSLLASLVLLAAPTAHTFNPMKVMGCTSPATPGTVSAAQVLALGYWMPDQRARSPTQGSIEISASVDALHRLSPSLEAARVGSASMRHNTGSLADYVVWGEVLHAS
ncbi:hypothetical protein [Variovorax sp. tm]|uniref:hypothetical protein n=1 Tax=Variovorax atrisoli TaxID=3394203 RepID=UPI003A81150C